MGVVALAGRFATTSIPALAQETTCGTDRNIDIAEMTWPLLISMR